MQNSLNKTLLDELVINPENFNLSQALRIIILTHGKNYADCLQYLKHKILVKPWLSLAFPSKSIISFTHQQDTNDFNYTLIQTEFGLYSTLGPLPTFYTEELLEDARNDEPISKDFLDIINNHLYKLNYQASLQYKFSRCYYELQDYRSINIVKSLLGEPTYNLNKEIAKYNNSNENQNNLFTNSIPLAFLPFLMYKEKTADNLETFLTLILNLEKNKLTDSKNIFVNKLDDENINKHNNSTITVKIEQCVEKTIKLKLEFLCQLGKKNNELGNNILLGSYKKTISGHFRINLFNLNEFYFYELQQKDARLFILLQQAIKWFLDSPLTYDIVLHPQNKNSQKFALGSSHSLGRYLGENLTSPGKKLVIYND